MIYVAAPYNSQDKNVIQQRMELVYMFIGDRVVAGEHVFTPLFMHEIATRYDLPPSFDFWDKICLNMLGRCDKMYVLMLEGWDVSRGVKAEIDFCNTHGIPVEFFKVVTSFQKT